MSERSRDHLDDEAIRRRGAAMATPEHPLPSAAQDAAHPLAGSIALVTGGASGIGLAVARRLRQSGARLVLLDIDAPRLSELQPEVERADRGLTFVADVRDRHALERVRDALDSSGMRPDIVVANAGVNTRTMALELSDADLRRIIDTNLYGTFVTLQVFGELAIQQAGARIIATSSVSAVHGMTLRAAYVATKAGISGLIRSLAIEWGPHGATVNAVGPGIIRTPLLDSYIQQHPERVQAALANTPLGRLGAPEDVADVVAFLASDAARFITGQTIFVDGGLSAGSSWW